MIGDPPDRPTSATSPPPPPAPNTTAAVLAVRMAALRCAAMTGERAAPAGVITDRAEEYERWIVRDLVQMEDDGW